MARINLLTTPLAGLSSPATASAAPPPARAQITITDSVELLRPDLGRQRDQVRLREIALERAHGVVIGGARGWTEGEAAELARGMALLGLGRTEG